MRGLNDLITDFYDVYNRADAAALEQLYDTSAQHEEGATGRATFGPAAIARNFAQFRAQFDALRWTAERRVLAGASGAVFYTMEGRFTGSLGPWQGRGQAVSLQGAHLFRSRDGRIARTEDLWSAAEFRAAVEGVS